MPSIANISEWVIAVRQGNSIAWNKLYQQFYPGIYAIALNYCDHLDDAADAVQETFITAFLKIQQLKEPAAFAGWIKKIVVNHCLRKNSKKHTRNEMNPGLIADSDIWMERVSETSNNEERLNSILSQLAEPLRITTMLRYFSAYNSYEEMAAILGTPVGTVRSRLNQAKVKLAENWKRTTGHINNNQESAFNNFYEEAFSRMHVNDATKNRFLDHLTGDVHLQLNGKKELTGRKNFESMIISDRKHGSQLCPVNIYSSGNLSIVESKHINSSEYPNHCPTQSVLLLYRKEDKISKMSFHVSC